MSATGRRALAIALGVATSATAWAGAKSQGELGYDAPPALHDEGRAPSDDATLAKARLFLRAVSRKRPELVAAHVAIPFVQYFVRPGRQPESEAHCFNTQRFVDEHEGFPGAPQCQFPALAKHVAALQDKILPDAIFPDLNAVEAKEGKLGAPIRKLLAKLRHHRFVAVHLDTPAGAVRLVLALRNNGGGGAAVDAVYAEVPAWERARTPPRDGKLPDPFRD